MESSANNNTFMSILKGVGLAFTFSVIALSIFACLLVFTNMSETLMQPVVIGITGISILAGSFIANRKMTKNGIINGILVGVIYIGLIYIISSVINGGNFGLSLGAIIMFAAGIIGGAIGGIIGVNIG